LWVAGAVFAEGEELIAQAGGEGLGFGGMFAAAPGGRVRSYNAAGGEDKYLLAALKDHRLTCEAERERAGDAESGAVGDAPDEGFGRGVAGENSARGNVESAGGGGAQVCTRPGTGVAAIGPRREAKK